MHCACSQNTAIIMVKKFHVLNLHVMGYHCLKKSRYQDASAHNRLSG